jgi:hypothetical protein
MNIISVYKFTGNPDDDGYLESASGQQAVSSQLDPKASPRCMKSRIIILITTANREG